MSYNLPPELQGLTQQELNTSREKYGFNQTTKLKNGAWYNLVLDILKEPMLLLLMAVSIIYFINKKILLAIVEIFPFNY